MKGKKLPKLNRAVVFGTALALAVVIGAGGFVARRAADAAEPLEGDRVSAADVRILVRAASSCSALTPARLAGQVMATSSFSSRPVPALREGGRTGISAMTSEQWRTYAPWPGADPADRDAGITALAHATCQFIGQTRALKILLDPWRVALAGYRLGMDQVIAAGDIPDGARDYVDTAERYATWYALQPAFGGRPASPAPTTAAAGGAMVPVPSAYVGAVVAAGKVCAEMPSARIAAQIMATSAFDPNRLGPAGEQGIAQFRPQVWSATVEQKGKSTPWEPVAAIRALGGTMCKLVQDSGGQYGPALAAFTRGDRNAPIPLAEVVTKTEAEYAKDSRLQSSSAPLPAAAPGAAPAAPGAAPAAPGAAPAAPGAAPAMPGRPNTSTSPKKKQQTKKKRAQPPVKASDGKNSKGYGPYFILNQRTGLCVDLLGVGAGALDGAVLQNPCIKTAEDNQEWTFMPRGTDGNGYQLYWIRNIDDNYCIDPPGAGKVPSSTELSHTACFDGDNQYFRLEPKGTAGGFLYYWLRDTVANMCLEVPGRGTGGPGARLALVPCLSNDDHEWALVKKDEW